MAVCYSLLSQRKVLTLMCFMRKIEIWTSLNYFLALKLAGLDKGGLNVGWQVWVYELSSHITTPVTQASFLIYFKTWFLHQKHLGVDVSLPIYLKANTLLSIGTLQQPNVSKSLDDSPWFTHWLCDFKHKAFLCEPKSESSSPQDKVGLCSASMQATKLP